MGAGIFSTQSVNDEGLIAQVKCEIATDKMQYTCILKAVVAEWTL